MALHIFQHGDPRSYEKGSQQIEKKSNILTTGARMTGEGGIAIKSEGMNVRLIVQNALLPHQ